MDNNIPQLDEEIFSKLKQNQPDKTTFLSSSSENDNLNPSTDGLFSFLYESFIRPNLFNIIILIILVLAMVINYYINDEDDENNSYSSNNFPKVDIKPKSKRKKQKKYNNDDFIDNNEIEDTEKDETTEEDLEFQVDYPPDDIKTRRALDNVAEKIFSK
jgi:hypothetical protein